MVFFSFFSSDVPPDYYSFSDVPSDEKKAAAPLRAGKLRQKYTKKVLTAGSAGVIPDRQSIIAPYLIAVKLLPAIYTVNILYHRGAHISSIF